jgi:hypothetical protein
MGIFTRLFRGQDGESEDPPSEGETTESEELAAAPPNGETSSPPPANGAQSPSITPRQPRASRASRVRFKDSPADGVEPGEGQPVSTQSDDEDTDRRALLSPTPKLAGGLKVASRPRRNKTTNPPPNGVDTAATPPPTPALPEKKPARPVRPPQQHGEATTRIAVPPPAQKPPARVAAPVLPVPVSKSGPLGKVPPRSTRPGSVVPNPPAKPRRRRSPISEAFDLLVDGDGDGDGDGESRGEGVLDASDRKAVQEVFDDLAAEHVEVVRNVMLELEVEDVVCSWIERSKPPLESLRKMAQEMDLGELCEAIDAFCEAIDAAIESGQATVAGARKAELQRRYKRLIELIPQAFALEGERDRREPIIVESLLRQVAGVEKITIDKLFAVGLNKLAALIRSNATDIAATSGVDPALAAAIAERFRSYRDAVPSAVAAQDSDAERAQLRRLVDVLKYHHREYNDAAAGWSDQDRVRKREARRLREEAFLQVRVALARLGETQQLAQIERRPFDQRIAAVERWLEREQHGRAHP